MSSEIENFREAVAKFDELQIELELIKESLEQNFGHYKSISTTSLQNIEDFKRLVTSMEMLQTHASEITQSHLIHTDGLSEKISSQYRELYKDANKEFTIHYNNLHREIKLLKHEINSMVQNAINTIEIDTQTLENVINRQLDKFDVSQIEDTVTKLHQWLHKIKEVSNEADKRIEGINNSVKNINQLSFFLSYSVMFSIAFLGIFLGFVMATFFKIEALSDYYFTHYTEKQEKLESDIKQLNSLSQWLLKNNINLHYVQSPDTKDYFIMVKEKDTKKIQGRTSGEIEGEGTYVFIRDLQ